MMHEEREVLFPYLQGLGLGIFEETKLHLQEELLRCWRIDGIRDDNIIIDDGNNGHLPILGETASNLGLNSSIPEYDLITTEPIAMTEESEHIQGDVYYSCETELLGNPVIEELFSDLYGIEFQEQYEEKKQIACNNGFVMELPIQKSVSLDCLDTSEWADGVQPGLDFFNFQEMQLGDVIRMRRAYSDGDIKTLGADLNLMKTSVIHIPVEQVLNMENHKMEARRQKLSRYMKKKAKRNFGRKIKYACRKALADSQPRVRGRFAKTECCETSK